MRCAHKFLLAEYLTLTPILLILALPEGLDEMTVPVAAA